MTTWKRRGVALAAVSGVLLTPCISASASASEQQTVTQAVGAAQEGPAADEANGSTDDGDEILTPFNDPAIGNLKILSGISAWAHKIWDLVADAVIAKANRSGLVRSLMNAAWYQGSQKYNVAVLMAPGGATKGRFTTHFEGVQSDAVYDYDGYPPFRVVIFKSGTVTNNGDGGYINWAYKGWFNRKDMTVHFKKP